MELGDRPGNDAGRNGGASRIGNATAGSGAGFSPLGTYGSSELLIPLGEGGGSGGTRWTAWAQADRQYFGGNREAGEYSGELATTYVGVDARLSDQWLAGVAASWSGASSTWSADTRTGTMTTSVTSLQPYLRWSSGSSSVWTMFGTGGGEIGNVRDLYDMEERRDLGFRMGLVEGRRRIASLAGVELSLRGDAAWAELRTSEGAAYELINNLGVSVHQLRVGIDMTRRLSAGAASIEPFAELHARRDGGDGQTGTGMEMAAGLRMNHGIVCVEGAGRLFRMRQRAAGSYHEHGFAITVSIGEGGRRPGPSLEVQPRWGAPATGSQMLWQDQLHLHGLGGSEPERAVDVRAGYGVEMGRGLITPFGVYSESQYGNRMELGMSLSDIGPVELESSVERQRMPGYAAADGALRMSVRGSISWGTSGKKGPAPDMPRNPKQ